MAYLDARKFIADPATSPELLAKIYTHFAVYEAFRDLCPYADKNDERYDENRLPEHAGMDAAEKHARLEIMKFRTGTAADLKTKVAYIRFHAEDAFEDIYCEDLEALFLSLAIEDHMKLAA